MVSETRPWGRSVSKEEVRSPSGGWRCAPAPGARQSTEERKQTKAGPALHVSTRPRKQTRLAPVPEETGAAFRVRLIRTCSNKGPEGVGVERNERKVDRKSKIELLLRP